MLHKRWHRCRKMIWFTHSFNCLLKKKRILCSPEGKWSLHAGRKPYALFVGVTGSFLISKSNSITAFCLWQYFCMVQHALMSFFYYCRLLNNCFVQALKVLFKILLTYSSFWFFSFFGWEMTSRSNVSNLKSIPSPFANREKIGFLRVCTFSSSNQLQ